MQNRTEETAFEYKEPFSASATPTTHNLSLDENMARVPQKEGGTEREEERGLMFAFELGMEGGGWEVKPESPPFMEAIRGQISTPPSSLLEIVHSYSYH